MDEDAVNEAIEDISIGIYVLKDHASSDNPEDIGIVLASRCCKNWIM